MNLIADQIIKYNERKIYLLSDCSSSSSTGSDIIGCTDDVEIVIDRLIQELQKKYWQGPFLLEIMEASRFDIIKNYHGHITDKLELASALRRHISEQDDIINIRIKHDYGYYRILRLPLMKL